MGDLGYNKRDIATAIRNIAGFTIPINVIECVVVSVNESNQTCIVDSVTENSDINDLEVRYNLLVSDGEVSVPKVDSNVVVCFSDFLQPFVCSFTDLLKHIIFIGNQSYSIEENFQKFNDGKYGGIPIVKSEYDGETEKGILSRINKIEGYLKTLKNNFTSWTPAPNDGGAALKTVISTPLTGFSTLNITDTIESDISNPNITHGKQIEEV